MRAVSDAPWRCSTPTTLAALDAQPSEPVLARDRSCLPFATGPLCPVLSDVFAVDREAIITGTRARVAVRTSPKPTEVELAFGIPILVDQIGRALRRTITSDMRDHEELTIASDLFAMGLTIGQVVHDYGEVCQTVTALALGQNAPISTDEFRTLDLCLDDAIAGAVKVYFNVSDLPE